MISKSNSIEMPIQTFFDLVTLTFELDLDILPLDLHAKIQVRMSVHSAVRVVTHRQDDVKTTVSQLNFAARKFRRFGPF